jgi:diamine N-acetyltransferase
MAEMRILIRARVTQGSVSAILICFKITGTMLSNRGSSPLSYHRIGHADTDVVSDLVLEPEQVEHYLGSIEEIQAALRSGPAHAMTGVEADGILVGFYVLHPDRRDNSCWWLGWCALDHRFQGRGYGRMAMAKIMTNVRHIVGCRLVRLPVSPANVPATRLYAQAGFHQVGEHTSGELILEVILSRFAVIEDIIALLRASSVSKPARRAGRLRLAPGPHAAQVIGVERGPPSVPAPPRTIWWKRLRVGSSLNGRRPAPSLGRARNPAASTCFDRSPRRSASAGC